MMESWHALPPAAQAVFDELAAQEVQRYQQEVVELIAMGRLPLSYMESLQFQPQRQRQLHKRRRQDQMSR
jgi:hypothetical protein